MEEKLKKINRIVEILCFIGIGLMAFIFLIYCAYFGTKEYQKYQQSNYDRQKEEKRLREIEAHNGNISIYVDREITGAETILMIDEIIFRNQISVDDEGQFIGVMIKNGESLASYSKKDQEQLKKACEEASVFDETDGCTIVNGNNTEKNVQRAENEMEKLKKQLDTQKKYKIEAYMFKEIYTWIIISEAE